MKKLCGLGLIIVLLVSNISAVDVLNRRQKGQLCTKLNNTMAKFKGSQNKITAKLGDMSGPVFSTVVCPALVDEAAKVAMAQTGLKVTEFIEKIQAMLKDSERICIELPGLIALNAGAVAGRISDKAQDFVNKLLKPFVDTYNKLMQDDTVIDACFMVVDKKLHPEEYLES